MSDPVFDPDKCPGAPELPRIHPLEIDCDVPEPPGPIREGKQIDTFAGSAFNAIVVPTVSYAIPYPVTPPGDGGGATVYPLTDCQGLLPTLCAANNLAGFVGKVLKLDTCREVGAPTTDLSACGLLTLVNPAIAQQYDDCQSCLTCWRLTLCGDPGTTLITAQNMAAYEGKAVRLESGDCYSVERWPSCVNAQAVVVIAAYDNCSNCGGCYVIARCGSADTKIVYNDLAALVGVTSTQVVSGDWAFQIDGECWYATEFIPTCSGSAEAVEIEAVHPTCTSCGCYALVSVEDGSIVSAYAAVDGDGDPLNLGNHLGQIAKLDDGECYRIEPSTDCDAAQEVTVLTIYGSTSPCDTCYELSDCTGALGNILTHTDLSLYQAGQVLRNALNDSCWTLVGATTCSSSTLSFFAEGPFSTCADCQGTTKYRLQAACTNASCFGNDSPSAPDIITTTNLRSAVGRYVGVGGVCYSVSLADPGATVTQDPITASGPFDTCAECAGTPITGQVYVPIYYPEEGLLWVTHRWLQVSAGLIVGECWGDDEVLCVCQGHSDSDSESETEPPPPGSDSDSESEPPPPGSDSDSESEPTSDSDSESESESESTPESDSDSESESEEPGTLYRLQQCFIGGLGKVVSSNSLPDPFFDADEFGAIIETTVYRDVDNNCWYIAEIVTTPQSPEAFNPVKRYYSGDIADNTCSPCENDTDCHYCGDSSLRFAEGASDKVIVTGVYDIYTGFISGTGGSWSTPQDYEVRCDTDFDTHPDTTMFLGFTLQCESGTWVVRMTEGGLNRDQQNANYLGGGVFENSFIPMPGACTVTVRWELTLCPY